jgi:hypothetical protein
MDDRIWIRIEYEGTIYTGCLFPKGYGWPCLPELFRVVMNNEYMGDLHYKEGSWSGSLDKGLQKVIIDYIMLWYE